MALSETVVNLEASFLVGLVDLLGVEGYHVSVRIGHRGLIDIDGLTSDCNGVSWLSLGLTCAEDKMCLPGPAAMTALMRVTTARMENCILK